ncbi:MAG: VWA domain-containing protein [Leptospiraceae bacterium]|nr:VWA domain-containing protein [Leptospiraceae bacterium]
MGSGTYSNHAYRSLKARKGYDTKNRDEIFESRNLDPDMDPRQIKLRESRDSAEHPDSLAIIVALDVTGSMGFIPEALVKDTLPDLMGSLIEAGIEHPQVLFLGIGDHVYDSAPLQVGQFESSAELLDRWLTRVFLEGGGGGNGGESYHLAHFFASRFTTIDCFEKRQAKGFLFTIGDEPCLPELPAEIITRITSLDEGATMKSSQVIAEAQKMYEVFHLHVEHGPRSLEADSRGNWADMLGENLRIIKDHTQVAREIAKIIIQKVNDRGDAPAAATPLADQVQVEDML